ncbi:MAG: TlpA family protein disulfide reductase [Actinomycetota bacterium]|nr:TlpA family protein disulfide reductase [Actinomycetota bacterium]
MVPTNELEGFPKTSPSKRILLWVTIGAVLTGGLVLVLRPADKSGDPKPAPDFELPLLVGGDTLSSRTLRGSPVVLNFFASWCLPCREEAPLLQRTYERYRNRGVKFVGVNIQDTEEDAKRFVKEFGITFPVIKDYDQELFRELRLLGLPQTVFITKDWTLSSVKTGDQLGSVGGTATLGAITAEELTNQIEELLDE